MSKINIFTTENKYDIVLADPPWKYYGDPNKMAAAGKHYLLMDLEEICNIPVKELIHPNSVVFLWTTSVFVEDSIKVLNAWNCFYRGVAFVWIKTKFDGTPIGAQGVRPSITKPLTEFVLVGSPVAKGRPLKLHSESVMQTIFAPRKKHSQKPEECQERISELYPGTTKLELFARRELYGWDAMGFDIDGCDIRERIDESVTL